MDLIKGNGESTFRKMEPSDLPKIIAIITQHDEDDGEAAQHSFDSRGLDNHFVIEIDNRVIGVTGYVPIDATDNSYWLSWTYIAESAQGHGHGRYLLESLLAKLKELQARKLFVKVSDYQDPEDGDIYATARALYAKLGFIEELVIEDYYDTKESLHLLSYSFFETTENSQVAEEKPVIQFNGLYEINETDGAYSFSWTTKKPGILSFLEPKTFSQQDLTIGLQGAHEAGARKVFLSFPSNLPLVARPLVAANFKYLGQIDDYYEPGLHEIHYGYTFN